MSYHLWSDSNPAPTHVSSPVSPSQVVNLQYSEVQDRVMLTGRHMVRDVSCKNCNSKLGWIYEFATEDSQRYKEGRVILERALVRESEGFEEHVPSDNSWTLGLNDISPLSHYLCTARHHLQTLWSVKSWLGPSRPLPLVSDHKSSE